MKEKQKAVIVLSGGVDSTTLLYDLNSLGCYELFPIIFDYGQKHRREIALAVQSCTKLKIPPRIANLRLLNELAPSALTRNDVSVPEGHYEEESMKQTVVPNRNMVFLSLAVSYGIGIGARYVFYGAHSGDHAIYPDCRTEFVQAMQEVIRLCDWHQIQIDAPYLLMDKAEIVKIGLKLGVDYSLTTTCYNGKELACGKCGSCQERLEAFAKNNATDPIEYASQNN
jgi:7-cyano-7-deazaguanine synthase